MAGRPPPPRRGVSGKRRRGDDWDEEMPPGDSRSPERTREVQVRRQSSRLLERDREVRAGSRSRSPLRRVVLPGGRRSSSRSLSRRGPRSRPPGRVTESRGALPRRRVGVLPDDGGQGWGRRGSGLTLTPAAGAKRRSASAEFGPGRRRYDGPRRGEREEEDSYKRQDPERSKKFRLRLEDWILAVNLLLSWDDQKTISAAEMEEFLSRFLEYDAKVKYRITPRLTSEIFLRGILRTLWDIDRLLRVMNPGEELKMVTAKSPLVLSILRVMAYELMWTPNCTSQGAKEGAWDLMEKVNLSNKADRDWITDAMNRMGDAFEKAHNEWDKKHAAAKEKKRRERAEQAAAAGVGGDLAAGGAKVKSDAKAAKAARAGRKHLEGEDPRAKRKGADAQFGNARALAVKEQALAGKAEQSAESQKSSRAVVVRAVRPTAAQEEGDEDEEREEKEEKELKDKDAEKDKQDEQGKERTESKDGKDEKEKRKREEQEGDEGDEGDEGEEGEEGDEGDEGDEGEEGEEVDEGGEGEEEGGEGEEGEEGKEGEEGGDDYGPEDQDAETRVAVANAEEAEEKTVPEEVAEAPDKAEEVPETEAERDAAGDASEA